MKIMRRTSEPTSIRNLRREMEHFFDDLIPFSWTREDGGNLMDTWAPTSDISEDEKEYLVVMDLPGIAKKDIKVNFQDGRLTVTGESQKEEKEEKKDYIRRERYKGSFYRSFTLPESIKEDAIKADFKEGVLKIHIPKAEVSKPKEVSIN
jgi:HSP20 family protein